MRALLIAAAAASAIVCAAPAAADTKSRSCLTRETRSLLEDLEHAFGRLEVVSTCRPGARIAGSGHISEHARGKAVDVQVARRLKRKVVRWLYARAAGVVMTYRNMAHVHFDTGRFHKLVLGADAYGGRHWPRRIRHATLH